MMLTTAQAKQLIEMAKTLQAEFPSMSDAACMQLVIDTVASGAALLAAAEIVELQRAEVPAEWAEAFTLA